MQLIKNYVGRARRFDSILREFEERGAHEDTECFPCSGEMKEGEQTGYR